MNALPERQMELIEELDKLAELEKRATPRPWQADLEEAGEESSEVRSGASPVANVYGRNDFPCLTDEDPQEAPVSEFFANAALMEESRNLFPELLECAKALEPLARAYSEFAYLEGCAKSHWKLTLDGGVTSLRLPDLRRAFVVLDALQKKLTGKADGEDQPK